MAHKSTNEESATRLLGLQKDLGNKLINGSRSLDDLYWFNNLPPNILRQLVEGNYELVEPKNPYFRLISGGETVTISACKGGKKANIYHAKKTFPGYIDPGFNNYGINLPQPATEETEVLVYEIYKNRVDFKTLFGSLCPDLVKKYSYTGLPDVDINEVKTSLKQNNILFESQEQIETFCQENKQWLRTDSYGIFFLFIEEVNGEEKFFVAYVHFDSGGLEVRVYPLSYGLVWWDGSSAHRFVAPATKNSDTQS